MSSNEQPYMSTAPSRGVNYDALKRIGRELLVALGHDPESDGLRDTPRRFADAWREFIEYDAGRCDTSFETAGCDEMVVVRGVEVQNDHERPTWSLQARQSHARRVHGDCQGLTRS